MNDHTKMYYLLFDKITDIIEELQEVQKQAEELYIQQKGTAKKISIFKQDKD